MRKERRAIAVLADALLQRRVMTADEVVCAVTTPATCAVAG